MKCVFLFLLLPFAVGFFVYIVFVIAYEILCELD